MLPSLTSEQGHSAGIADALDGARRAVLVGDHRQLPPLFQEGDEARSFMDEVEESEAASAEENSAGMLLKRKPC